MIRNSCGGLSKVESVCLIMNAVDDNVSIFGDNQSMLWNEEWFCIWELFLPTIYFRLTIKLDSMLLVTCWIASKTASPHDIKIQIYRRLERSLLSPSFEVLWVILTHNQKIVPHFEWGDLPSKGALPSKAWDKKAFLRHHGALHSF